MKIVIDISKNEYNDIIEQVKKCDYPDMGLGKIIANGKPYEERPKGKWLLTCATQYYRDWYKCSNCAFPLQTREIELKHHPYCPNCGADMRCDIQ